MEDLKLGLGERQMLNKQTASIFNQSRRLGCREGQLQAFCIHRSANARSTAASILCPFLSTCLHIVFGTFYSIMIELCCCKELWPFKPWTIYYCLEKSRLAIWLWPADFFFNLNGGFIVDVFIDSHITDFSIVKMSFQRDEIKFYLMAHTFNPALRKQVDHWAGSQACLHREFHQHYGELHIPRPPTSPVNEKP